MAHPGFLTLEQTERERSAPACPFCGSKAYADYDPRREEVFRWGFVCTNEEVACNARILFFSSFETALEAWSRRRPINAK